VGEVITDSDLKDMIDIGDMDGDAHINEEEFLKIMLKTNLFRL
jgi:hypothetical protein